MQTCAYCDDTCKPTREHVIPDWYNETPGATETFSVRAPLTHLKGDLLVKDVCGRCNNGVLSDLDSYGKQLYERFFAIPAYADGTITFEYEGDRLIRWLLKLSYNSARAQNADARVLGNYRKVMLGESPLTERVKCWVRLIGASCFDDNNNVVRPARLDEQGQSNVVEPRWFRIGQFRLADFEGLSLVQRSVTINSYSFTLVVARVEAPWPCPEFDKWNAAFARGIPAAKPILPGVNSVKMSTGFDHAAASLSPLVYHFPTRFVKEKNSCIVKGLKDQLGLVILMIPRELIEEGNVMPIASGMLDMVSTREKSIAFRQRVDILVDGYDDDPRALWKVPQAQAFFRRLFAECPFVMLLAHPNGALLKLLAACWIYDEIGMTEEVQQQRMQDFLILAFRGLNRLNHTVMLSEEQNRQICSSAVSAIFDDFPPIE